MQFVGNATRRTEAGLVAAADLIGCGVAALMADVQVEAASSGFDAAHRPKALFEPHVFYRNLAGAARARAVKAGLAYPRWGTKPYPADSYPRIDAAMAIDAEAALKATSWGLPQILGENHAAAGYATAAAMVEAFVDQGEDEHLAAMARFIVSNPKMREALITCNWTAFAKLYNGPATKGYDTRLAKAYAQAVALHPVVLNTHLGLKAKASSGAAQTATGAVFIGSIAATVGDPPTHYGAALAIGAAVIIIVAALVLRATVFARKSSAFAALPSSQEQTS